MEIAAVIDIDNLSKYLRPPMPTLNRLVRESWITSHTVGKRWRFLRQALDHRLERPCCER